jgi:recombination DNA repair RAD52 pathway protein
LSGKATTQEILQAWLSEVEKAKKSGFTDANRRTARHFLEDRSNYSYSLGLRHFVYLVASGKDQEAIMQFYDIYGRTGLE